MECGTWPGQKSTAGVRQAVLLRGAEMGEADLRDEWADGGCAVGPGR